MQRSQRREFFERGDQCVVDQRGLVQIRSPVNDAAVTPSMWSDSASNTTCIAAAWSTTSLSPIRSTIPSAAISPESGSTTAYFTDDEPELRTSTLIASAPGWR